MNRIASADQLARAIAKRLPPVTWVSGDEPLLVLEAADAVRAQARELGYEESDVDTIVEGALKQQRLLSIAPRQPTADDLRHIVTESL